MDQQDRDNTIRIRLDISVPTGSGVVVQSRHVTDPDSNRAASIAHPTTSGTLARQVGTRWYICAKGTCGSCRHVFVRVFEAATTAPSEPPADEYTLGMRPVSGAWQFDLLRIPGDPDVAKKIVAWEDSGSAYTASLPVVFTPTRDTQTYCEAYSLFIPGRPPVPPARDWSVMPDCWRFALAGCSNDTCENCACLNGEWRLWRARGHGGELLWVHKLDASFMDAAKPSWWRLSFNCKDGFMYLDCITEPDQPTGTSISYRRHESVWEPLAPNTMQLLTNHGYCQVPDHVTLYPA